jgi:hypothetical protein
MTPIVLGELNSSGFSNYLQSIDKDDTLIVAIGIEADNNEISHGLQLTLFNTTNQTNPEIVHRYVMATNSSELQWNVQGFGYYPRGDQGRIIIPTSYDDVNGTSFDGFSVFSLSLDDGIAPLFDIPHTSGGQGSYLYGPDVDVGAENWEIHNECFICADSLLDRSFVIDGNVITVTSQSARSHNLDSGEYVWGLNFTGPDFCCGTSTIP